MNALVKPPVQGIAALWRASASMDGPVHCRPVHAGARAPTVAEILDGIPDLPKLFRLRGAVTIGFADDAESFRVVPRKDWHRVRPRAVPGRETMVSIHGPMHGGGGGNGLKLGLSIAVLLAAALVTGGAAGALGITAGFGTTGTLFTAGSVSASILGATIAIGGTLAIAALTKPPSLRPIGVEAASISGGNDSIQAGALNGNILRPGAPLPRAIGTIRMYPQAICNSLEEIVGNDVYAEQVFGAAGPHTFTAARSDDIALDDIDECEYETVEGKEDSPALTLVTRYSKTQALGIELSVADVLESDGFTLRNQGAPTVPQWHSVGVTRPSPDEAWLYLDFPEGQFNDQTANDYIDRAFRFRARRVGDSNWINLPEIHVRNWKSQPFKKAVKFMFMATPNEIPVPAVDEAPIRAYRKVPAQTDTPSGVGGWTADAYFSLGGSDTVAGTANTGIYAVSAGSIGNLNDGSAATSVSWLVNTNLTAAAVHDRRLAVIDFGGQRAIKEITVAGLSISSSAAAGVGIYTSPDGLTWTLYVATFTVTTTPSDFTKTSNVDARYVALMASAQDFGAGFTFTAKEMTATAGGELLSAATAATTSVTHTLLFADRVEFYLNGATWPMADDDKYEFQMIGSAPFFGSLFNQVTYTYSGPGTILDFFSYYLASGSGLFVVPLTLTHIHFKCIVKSLASIRNEPVMARPGVAAIAVRVHKRQLGQISVLASGLVPDYDSGSGLWTGLVATSNPAPHYRDVLLGRQNASALPAAMVNDTTMIAWRQACIDNFYECNAVIEGRFALDVLDMIASCGYARRRQSEVIDVLMDRDRSAESITQMFSPRNMRGFSFAKGFPRKPSGLRVRFRDRDDDYREKEIIVLDPFGTVDDGRYEDTPYDGIDTEAAAIARAEFDQKQLSLRMAFYSGEVPGEAIKCRRGDLVGVQHDVLNFDTGFARIESVTRPGGMITGVMLDAAVDTSGDDFFSDIDEFFTDYSEFFLLARYGCQIRLRDGTTIVKEFRRAADQTRELVFVTPFADPGEDVLTEDALVVTGPLGTESRRMIVFAIDNPDRDFVFPITFVDEAPELWQ